MIFDPTPSQGKLLSTAAEGVVIPRYCMKLGLLESLPLGFEMLDLRSSLSMTKILPPNFLDEARFAAVIPSPLLCTSRSLSLRFYPVPFCLPCRGRFLSLA